jgi:hypothetical protein
MRSPACPKHWSIQQRLDRYSVGDPRTGCILWTACRNANGYGLLTFKRRRWQAHRASWTAHRGPIPTGLLVSHHCDVRTCINPDHLFLGTHKDNMADKAAKQGHERRTEEGPERRPSKAPEIMRVHMFGREFVTRVLAIHPLQERPPAFPRTTRRSIARQAIRRARRPRSRPGRPCPTD